MKYLKIENDILTNKRLSPTDKMLYAILRDKSRYHNGELFYCYEEYMVEMMNVSKSTIHRTIERLEELGYIEVYRKYNDSTDKTTNYYKVN